MDKLDLELEEKLKLFRMLAAVFGSNKEYIADKLESSNQPEEPLIPSKTETPTKEPERFSALRAKLSKSEQSTSEVTPNAEN